jgi:hypothetical protein
LNLDAPIDDWALSAAAKERGLSTPEIMQLKSMIAQCGVAF